MPGQQQGGEPAASDGIDIDIDNPDGDGAARQETTVVDRPPRGESSPLLQAIDDVLGSLDTRRTELGRAIAEARVACKRSAKSVDAAEQTKARAQEELDKAKLETAQIEAEKTTLETIRALLFQQPDLSVHVALQKLKDDREATLASEEGNLTELGRAKDKAYTQYLESNSAREAAVNLRRLTSTELVAFGEKIDEKLQVFRSAEAIEEAKKGEVNALKILVESLRMLCSQGEAREQDIVSSLGRVQTKLRGALNFQEHRQHDLESADSNVASAKVDLAEHETALAELEKNSERLEAMNKTLEQAYEMASRGEGALKYAETLAGQLAVVLHLYDDTAGQLDSRTSRLLENVLVVRESVRRNLHEGAGRMKGLEGVLGSRHGSLTEALESLSRAVDVFSSSPGVENADGIRATVENIANLCRSPMDDADVGMIERDAREMADVTTRSVNDIDPAALRNANAGLSARIDEIEGAERNLRILLEAAGVETVEDLNAAIRVIRDASRGFDSAKTLPPIDVIATGLSKSIRRPSARSTSDSAEGEDTGSS